MAKFWLCAAVGFYALLHVCAARMDLNISCRYAGVFHVEKNQRYSLTREEAVQLCEALNSTIPTAEQMEKAFTLGFETCRYGYIEDKIVLPRHTPYYLCAANNTGIYVLASNISDRYDTYCFNSSESRDVVCEPVKKLYSALPNNNSSIEIFNADGSRYVEGKKVTERPQVTEDDSSVGSGSAFGRGTADPSDFTSEDDITAFTPEYGTDDHRHQHPRNPEDQNPTVNSSKDVKQEESAYNILLPAVHSGRDSEVRYSTNDTSADVLPGIVEQYSTTTAVSSSDDFFKQEDSKQPQLEGASPELEIEDTVSPAINTSDVLHPEFSPSDEKESTLEKESFHHPVTFSNGSFEHEEENQHQPSAVDTVAQRSQSSVANRTIHDILQVLVSPRDSYYENASSQSAVVSSVNTHSEVPTRDSLLHLKNSEEKYHTNTSREQLLPGILHTTATTVVSKEKGKGNETTQNPSFYEIHPGLDNKNDLPENKTREDVQSEIIQLERKPELETTQTAVISTEADGYEDSTQDPLIKEDPDLNEKLHHSTNSSINDFIPGISNLTDNVQENKTSHTVAILKDLEDSAQSPLPPIYQPDWISEEKPTNTSSSGTEISKQHENERDFYEDVGFYGTKEDPTSEPVRQWVSEDKYTTKPTMDVLFPGIVPRRGINQKNKTDHTVVASSDGDKNEKSDLGPEWHPKWTSNDEKLINNSQDPINRHPPSTDSPDPNKHSSVVRDKNVTPLPEESGKSQPRMAHIPDWLIVVASLLALALILGVCIAVNSRRRCGQKKKLVINNGKGGIDEKKKDGLNGEASKSQEMVHLVHKEKPEDQKGSHDEFQAIDETQNQQDVPLKSGM
ncbi:CD44 antigen isoform X6 [Pantherophis guttatus]|uniref:CD44 antigen n=1 Tax=Pantherophis guttatus TaxID=94885 RepID=A0A6P9C0K3_PANGU|nr:CD44 antigen isoform X6 [Pantherophis guttatus]